MFMIYFRNSRPEVLCNKGVVRNFARDSGTCFFVNFVKFLRRPFFTEYLRWLLVYTLWRILWNMEIQKIDFHNFIYRERLFFWIILLEIFNFIIYDWQLKFHHFFFIFMKIHHFLIIFYIYSNDLACVAMPL